MIPITCPSCKRPLKAPEEKSGQVLRCPSCMNSVYVPLESRQTDDAPLELVASESSQVRKAPPQTPVTLTSRTVETERCSHCGLTTVFPEASAGQTGECATCGQLISIPTLKQYQYRLQKQRATGWWLRFGLIAIGLLLVFIFGISYYASHTPAGAAITAWHASRPNAHKLMSVEYALPVASHGDISIVHVYASTMKKREKFGLDGNDVFISEYLVMRGLECLEIVTADDMTLEKLKRKYGFSEP